MVSLSNIVRITITLPFALVAFAGVHATDTPAPAPTPQAYSINTTMIGALLDNPVTKAVLDQDLPGLSTHESIDMARAMTLKQVQQFAPDKITDERLAKVEADFAKLPATTPNATPSSK